MKRNFGKRVLTFLIVTALTIGVAAASTGSKTLTVTYSNVTITIDGLEITPKNVGGTVVEPFIVDGTTYLPARAIAEALGKEVDWDAKTNTVVITTPINAGTGDPFEEIYFQTPTELENYLYENYSPLQTPAGNINLDFWIGQNTDFTMPHDIEVIVLAPEHFFDIVDNGKDYTEQEKTQIRTVFREHMMKLAADLIDKLPKLKLRGSYVDLWETEEGPDYNIAFTWRNYYQPEDTLEYPYDQAYMTQFTWHPIFDLPLWQ